MLTSWRLLIQLSEQLRWKRFPLSENNMMWIDSYKVVKQFTIQMCEKVWWEWTEERILVFTTGLKSINQNQILILHIETSLELISGTSEEVVHWIFYMIITSTNSPVRQVRFDSLLPSLTHASIPRWFLPLLASVSYLRSVMTCILDLFTIMA